MPDRSERRSFIALNKEAKKLLSGVTKKKYLWFNAGSYGESGVIQPIQIKKSSGRGYLITRGENGDKAKTRNVGASDALSVIRNALEDEQTHEFKDAV